MHRPTYAFAVPLFACLMQGGCAQPAAPTSAANGPNTPGWTGRTIVPGSHSTLAGDAQATYDQQKWPLGERP